MADRHDNDGTRRGRLTRRSYLRFAGASGLALGTASLLSGTSTADSHVDLGEEGLEEGDTIDGYLDDYFRSGNEVHIPPGTYNWNGGGLGGDYEDAALIGDGEPGDVVFDAGDDSSRYNAIHGYGGEVLVENVTIRGTNSGSPDKLRVDARDEDCTVTLRCVWKPDGTEYDGMGFYVGKYHVGEARFEHCWAEGFGDNGLYADGESDSLDGRVVVEGGLYRNNNIANVRVGTHDSVVRGVTMVHDKRASMRSSINQRNLRIRQPGENLVIEDCDIYHSIGSYRPVDMSSQLNDQGSGVIRNTRIYTESSNDAIRDHDGGWRAENVHLTGGGNYSIGISASNVLTDGDAEQASRHPLPPLPDSRDGDFDTGGRDAAEGQDDEEELPDVAPRTVAFVTSADAGQSDYSFTADGPIVALSDAPYDSPSGNPVRATSNYEIVEDGDAYRAAGHSANGYGDAYEVYGPITDVTLDQPDGMVIELDGEEVSEAELVERTSAEGDGDGDSTGEEREETGEGNDAELSNAIVIDGSSADGVSTYTFDVTGEVEVDSERTEVVGDGSPWDLLSSSVSDGHAVGVVGDGIDAYRYSGRLTNLEVRGDANVRLDRS